MEAVNEEYIKRKGYVQHGSIWVKSGSIIYRSNNRWYFAAGQKNVEVKTTKELGHEIYSCYRCANGFDNSVGMDI